MKLSYFKKHSTATAIVAAIVIFIAILAARSAGKKPTDTGSSNTKPLVHLLKAKDYSQNAHTVSANGTVESLQQVDLKSQGNGKLSKIYVKVGDRVKQGQVLATIDAGNAAAALTSARGALEQAQANYNKLIAGASSEQIDAAKVAVENATNNLKTTEANQETAVSNALSSLLNTSIAAIPGNGNTSSSAPVITGTYKDTAEGSYKISLYATGSGLRFQTSGLESASGDVTTQPTPLGTKGLYIQFSSNPPTSDTWTIAIPNTYAAAYVSNYNAYQTALKNKDSAISAANGQLSSAQAALAQAQAQARPADIQAAQAQILIAQGQVQAAEVAYSNTQIKAPFDGTVSALPVKFADVISIGQKVASVVNEGGMQLKIFVSGEDLPFIKIGAMAKIGEDQATGTVTNVAPSVDATSRTAEVDIAVVNPKSSNLTVGQNAAVIILGNPSAEAQTNSFVLPLQSVKLTPDGKAFVYKLDAGNKAQEVAVTIGKVDGEHVEVTSGLDENSEIVSNAYDVAAGDSVQLQ
ncbi:MAG: efflux RND transporter periplasmic adaptor subunit [Candidatus Doudnabacteria bacterium]|nr:efflux RND transporter periplasmic adaptor subunit [Candidatus Doudnabacteria bacterium]